MDALRRTKLICTIGPSSARRIDELVDAGMDVARINFSHGTEASHAAAARAVQRATDAGPRPIGILTDLAGPKIRLGELENGAVELVAGERFVLHPAGAAASPGTVSGASVSYRGLSSDVHAGDPILLADGAAELRVTAVDDDVITEVVRGGKVRSRAGVAIPALRVSAPTLTPRDRADVRRSIDLGASFIGQSFVRSADDVVELRRLIGHGGPGIVAKIETRPAVESFDAILDVADAVMIARGDLGVEVPYEEVPLIQKQLVRRALDRGVPSIVATQMLESMSASPRPTRAEASDIANAVFDGADALLLSGETAIGAYPVEAAAAAARIAAHAEANGAEYLAGGIAHPPASDLGALAYAAVALASANSAIVAIACYTRSGRTALLLSSLRPAIPVIAFSPDPGVVARLALSSGVLPRRCPPLDGPDALAELSRLLGAAGIVPDRSDAVLVSSTDAPGTAPNVLGVRAVRSTGSDGSSAPTGIIER